MHALAQSIGAGADLLASQNGMSTLAFDNKRSLNAARSELAAVTAIGARAALTRLTAGQPETHGSRAELHIEHPERLTPKEVRAMVDQLGDIGWVLDRANRADLAAL
jgi:hypothetical protein